MKARWTWGKLPKGEEQGPVPRFSLNARRARYDGRLDYRTEGPYSRFTMRTRNPSKYRTHVLARHATTGVHRALELGVVASFFVVLLDGVLAVFIWSGQQAKYLLDESWCMPEFFCWQFTAISRQMWVLFLSEIMCLMLLAVWWMVGISCVLDGCMLLVRLSLTKARLWRPRHIAHLQMQDRSLGAIIATAAKVGLTIFSGVAIVVMLRTETYAWGLFRVAIAFIVLFVLLLPTLAYLYDWRVARHENPKLVREVYNRRSSLGRLIETLVLIAFLALIVRAGLPALLWSADLIGQSVFERMAAGMLDTASASYVDYSIRVTGHEDMVFQLFPQVEAFSVRWWVSDMRRSMGPELAAVREMFFRCLYWVSLLIAVQILLVPMVLYNLTFSGRKALGKIAKATSAALLVGVGLPRLLSWLFLIPLPPVEIATLVSVVVFTTYATWMYTK